MLFKHGDEKSWKKAVTRWNLPSNDLGSIY